LRIPSLTPSHIILLLFSITSRASAGGRVGYESASQFSGEYSRLFGAPPQRDITRMRLAPVAAAAGARRTVARSAAGRIGSRHRSTRRSAASRMASSAEVVVRTRVTARQCGDPRRDRRRVQELVDEQEWVGPLTATVPSCERIREDRPNYAASRMSQLRKSSSAASQPRCAGLDWLSA
jgi:hypothetical protein